MTKFPGLVAAALLIPLLTVFAAPAAAYSTIYNADGWDREELAKAGIVVRPWLHEVHREDPPQPWVEVTFDCTGLRKEPDVVMTAAFRSLVGMTWAGSRTQRASAVDGKLTLVLLIAPPDVLDVSSLDVAIWSKGADGFYSARGYRLSLWRIAQLARQAEAPAPAQEP